MCPAPSTLPASLLSRRGRLSGRQATLRLAVRRADVVQDRHQRGLEPGEVARDPAQLGLALVEAQVPLQPRELQGLLELARVEGPPELPLQLAHPRPAGVFRGLDQLHGRPRQSSGYTYLQSRWPKLGLGPGKPERRLSPHSCERLSQAVGTGLARAARPVLSTD